MKVLVTLFLGLVFCIPTLAVAVTDDFTIKVLVGDDVTPPGTPTLLSAEAIATTQIDVTWSAVTDNFLLGGYVVLRDGTPIATTTLTSFSDTGLSPATLYSYSVYAFDSSNNISTTSNSLATTTPAVPVVATSSAPGPRTQEATLVVVVESFTIRPEEQTATVVWSTNIPARFMIRWGRTDEYAGGYIMNEAYQRESQTKITDLEPGTVYRYELIGYTPAGIAVSLRQGQFTTTAREENRVVPNVERLTHQVDENDVVLTFAIPKSEVGATVRVVRSHLGFPTDITDGAVIYEGTSEIIRDDDAFLVHERQYYTVFVIGADGSVSSGAVVLGERGVDREVVVTPGGGKATSSSTTSPESSIEPELALELLTETDIVIRQRGSEFTFLSEAIRLSHRDQFTLSIAKTALPPHLKSIIVTLLDPTDQRRSYSFLLRINKAGTAYEATIAPLLTLGTSRLEIEVYDFERRIVGRYRKQIDFVVLEEATTPVVFPDALYTPVRQLLYVFGAVLLFVLGWWFFLGYRRRHPEDKP